jgi:hypothetical protein
MSPENAHKKAAQVCIPENLYLYAWRNCRAEKAVPRRERCRGKRGRQDVCHGERRFQGKSEKKSKE